MILYLNIFGFLKNSPLQNIFYFVFFWQQNKEKNVQTGNDMIFSSCFRFMRFKPWQGNDITKHIKPQEASVDDSFLAIIFPRWFKWWNNTKYNWNYNNSCRIIRCSIIHKNVYLQNNQVWLSNPHLGFRLLFNTG